jgi:hypothetical protein
MTTKEFSVLSSDGVSAYTVTFEWNGKDLSVACNCKAGLIGDWCRHKSGLLNGDESKNSNWTEVENWINASPVCSVLTEIREAENQLKEVERLLKKAKVKVQEAKRTAADMVNPRLKK